MTNRKLITFTAIATIALFTAACASTGTEPSEPIGESSSATESNSPQETEEEASPEIVEVQVVDSGFGQSEGVTQAIVIAKSESELSVGEYVTASVNFLDKNGEIIATETQVESFSWVGQELLLPIWHFQDGKEIQEVETIDVSVTISDYGTPFEKLEPLPILDSFEIKEPDFGGYEASFKFTNDTATQIESLRVGIACFDNSGKIIGGGSTYPDLVAPGKEIRIDAGVETSSKPENCKAYLNHGV